jgi:hypothetical protein
MTGLRAAAARAEGNLQTGHSMPDPMRWKPRPEAPTYPENWPQNDSKPPGKVHQINSAQSPQGLDGNATSTVSVMRTVIEEPENGRLSDIDMDRFSAVSLTASSLSSSASFHSLARRIRRWKSRAERNPMDELPSSVMKWDSSSSSLQLFSQLSDTLSVASSQKTDRSRMSWRPEIPATIQEDGGASGEGILARFRRPKSVQISGPGHPVHMIHVAYDNTKKQFTVSPSLCHLAFRLN